MCSTCLASSPKYDHFGKGSPKCEKPAIPGERVPSFYRCVFQLCRYLLPPKSWVLMRGSHHLQVCISTMQVSPASQFLGGLFFGIKRIAENLSIKIERLKQSALD